MPNANYDPKGWQNDDIALDKTTKATPGSQSGKKLRGQTFDKASGETEGAYPMRYGTADWKMPGGFSMQPRDRTWGMRQAQGVPFEKGLDPKPEGLEGPEDTWVDRGAVSKSKPHAPGDKDRQ